MTGIILENITSVNDLSMFSKAYKEGLIKVNISKIAKELNKDRKTIKKYLEGYTPKETRDRVKYLDEHRDYIKEVFKEDVNNSDYYHLSDLFIKSSKPQELENTLNDLIKQGGDYYGLTVFNYETYMKQEQRMLLVVKILSLIHI